jgi:hypothetical protein
MVKQRRQAVQHSEAARILKSIVNGRDPVTGKDLPPDTVLQQVPVFRALIIAGDAIDTYIAREKRRATLPVRVGVPWTGAEDDELTREFKSGSSMESLAETHQRTLRAVQARLERLSLIPVEENAKFTRFPGEMKPPSRS